MATMAREISVILTPTLTITLTLIPALTLITILTQDPNIPTITIIPNNARVNPNLQQ